eukprot:14915188-Heterocapsa_arctica.AAC.1
MVALAARITGDQSLEKTGFSTGKGARTEQAINPGPVSSPPSLLSFKLGSLGGLCDRGQQRVRQGVDGNFVHGSRGRAV